MQIIYKICSKKQRLKLIHNYLPSLWIGENNNYVTEICGVLLQEFNDKNAILWLFKMTS